MLTQIRKKATSLISYVLIGLLILSFALWGIQDYLGNPADPVVASINGEEITKTAFENQVRNTELGFRQQFGDQFDERFIQNNAFRQNILDGMINSSLEREMVDEYNYSAPDQLLAEYITQIPQFQNESGEFDNTLYERVLAQNGLNVKTFEESQRIAVATNNFQETSSLLMSFNPKKIEDYTVRLINQKRDVEYTVLPFDSVEVDVTEEEIQAYYDENKDNHITEPKVKVSYIRLSQDELATNEEVSDEAIETYYESNKARYVKPEERTARHILFNASNDEASKKEAFEKAKETREKIVNGEDFAELAKEVSDDTGSALKGGDLGVVNRGVMVQPFEDAVFSLEANVLSEPVETEYGFHLIEVTNILPERGQSLDEVREDIANALKEEEALLAYSEKLESFENLVFENADTLEPIADELGLQIETTDFNDAYALGLILNNDQATQFAFTEEFRNSGINSDVFTDENSAVVMKFEEYKEPETIPLEQIKEEITELVTREKVLAVLEERADKLISEISADSSQEMSSDEVSTEETNETADVAQESEVTQESEETNETAEATSDTTDDIQWTKAPETRTGSLSPVERIVLDEAFSKKATALPVTDKVTVDKDVVVYRVNEVVVPEEITTIAEEQIESVKNRVIGYQMQSLQTDMFETLRNNADINIVNEEVNIY